METERYRKGAHTVLDLKYHCIWKTKYSHPILRGELGLVVRRIIREIAEEKKLIIVKGNIRADHVHLLVSAMSCYSPAEIAEEKKLIIVKHRSSVRHESACFASS